MISISLKEKAVFARQFATLVEAGLPITKVIHIVQQQMPRPTLKTELERIYQALLQGVSLSQAFEQWDPLMVYLMKAGEAGGKLAEAMERVAVFYEKRSRLLTKLVTTMTYPLVILCISTVIFIGIVVVIFPQFSHIYTRLGAELPAYTKFWMSLGQGASSPIGYLLLTFIVGNGIFLFRQKDKRWILRLLIHVPVMGELIVQASAIQFARTLGTLLECDVPLQTALSTLSADIIPLTVIIHDVLEGLPLDEALAKHPKRLPRLLTAMVSVGVETGKLSSLLLKAADYYEQELDATLGRLTSLLEPFIIIVLGGLIGAAVLGMYLPMFQIFDTIQ